MAEHDTAKNDSAPALGTSEEEVAKIKADKEAIHEAQQKAAESRSDDEFTADHSTGVNAANEEPINPEMPKMPPH